MKPTRERGRPARTTAARPRPTPPPGSTGNGAGAPLRPGSCGSRRRGGRLPHRRETERDATVVHAGGTPALPGGRLFQSLLLLEGAHAGLPVRRPCRCGRAVPLRGPSCDFVDHSFSFVSGKPRPRPAGRIIRGRNCRSNLKTNHQWTQMNANREGSPSVFLRGPSSFFVCLRGSLFFRLFQVGARFFHSAPVEERGQPG